MIIEIIEHNITKEKVEVDNYNLENGGSVFIGRSDECNIVLDDRKVSREHVEILFNENVLEMRKIAPTGDCALNGRQVQSAELNDGDIITINSFKLVISDLPKLLEEILEEKTTETEEDLTVIIEESPSVEIVENTELINDFEDVTDLDSEPDGNDLESVEDESITDESILESNDDANDFITEDEDLSSIEEDSSEAFNDNEDSTFSDGEDDAFSEDSDSFSEDDGFGDDGFGDDSDGFGGEEDSATQIFQSFASYSLRLSGENAPFDRFKIEDNEVFVGRDPDKCKICLNDTEVSGVHASFKKTLINLMIEDKDSSNGTIVNGERVNKKELVNGDIVEIGSTSFTVEIKSDLIETESQTLMPVEEDQEIEVVEEIEEEVDLDDMNFEDVAEEEEKSPIKRLLKDPKKRPVVIVVVALVLFLVLFGEDDKPKNSQTDSNSKVSKSKDKKAKGVKAKDKKNKKDLSPEVIQKLEQNYALALAKYEAGEYYEAKEYLDIIKGIDPEYKDTQTLLKFVQQGYEELVRLKKEEQLEKERQERLLKVEKLLVKAKDATKKREVSLAENLFSQIMELDPENLDVPQLKIELEAYKKDKEAKRLAAEAAKAKRQRMVDALKPGKSLYLKEDWFLAIDKLQKFTAMKDIDEDLIKDATDMIKTSKIKLSSIVNPLLGKARSFREGQDLKRAFETYGEILRFDPSNEESIIERENILTRLTTRSKKLYREALISESLSLFDEAKEKFEQVQQISPINSEYYNKATEKLKDYLE